MDLQPNKIDGIIKPITNTRISASEWNQLVGSCMEFITAAGMTPDANDNEQFLNAFKAIAASLELVGANTNLSNVTNTGTSTGAGWAMPSSVYDDLTIGAHGTTYTAPANGYFYCQGYAGSGAYVSLFNQTKNFGASAPTGNSGSTVFCLCPAQKGDVVATYFYGGSLSVLRFIYAEGSKSEAN